VTFDIASSCCFMHTRDRAIDQALSKLCPTGTPTTLQSYYSDTAQRLASTDESRTALVALNYLLSGTFVPGIDIVEAGNLFKVKIQDEDNDSFICSAETVDLDMWTCTCKEYALSLYKSQDADADENGAWQKSTIWGGHWTNDDLAAPVCKHLVGSMLVSLGVFTVSEKRMSREELICRYLKEE
jgi:hypothetical protein